MSTRACVVLITIQNDGLSKPVLYMAYTVHMACLGDIVTMP